MYIITLSFDDGFKNSCEKIAEIYEKHGCSACFNVIASGHHPDFPVPDEYQRGFEKGDFGLWNELNSRGHEVMPHGYAHLDKSKLPFDEAKASILKCLDYFEEHLEGFERRLAMFNFPYNGSTPELEEWILREVYAYRSGGDALMPVPSPNQRCIGTTGSGPGNCEGHLEDMLADLFKRDSGWLCFNLHGLDDEGWGPIRAKYLDDLLGRYAGDEKVRFSPACRALFSAS